MNERRSKGRPGPALTIGIPLVLAGVLGYFGAKQFAPALKSDLGSEPQAASTEGDARVVRVAADPWSGYSTFRGEPRFVAGLAREGLKVEYLDEEKYYDQDERMRALAAGELDLALTTLDAYLQHGANHLVDGQYPGVIVFGIDESNGGDAIFLEQGRGGFDEIKPTDKVCFSAGTPSEHLWDFASLAFANVGSNVTQDNGVVAKDCWDKLTAGQVQIAVLWQPYTALAEKAGYPKVFATGGQADDVIFDIAVANRQFAAENGPTVQKLVEAYFATIQSYQKDVKAHGEFITADCGPDCENDPVLGAAVLSGIDFLTLEENSCLWFGQCGTPAKVVDRTAKTGRLLIAKGKLTEEQLPSAESIVDSSFLMALKQKHQAAQQLAKDVAGPEADAVVTGFGVSEPSYEYSVPGAEDAAVDVGTLSLPPVYFAAGSYRLGKKAQGTVAKIADQLESFPALCVRIHGHTNSRGNARANVELSRLRAQSIADQLTLFSAERFPATRFDVKGFGSNKPIKRNGVEDIEASRRTEFKLFKCGSEQRSAQ